MILKCTLRTLYVLLMWASSLTAAQELLPEGIGLYRLSVRDYASTTHEFDDSGSRVELGERLKHNFDGKSMAKGSSGRDLQQLAKELNQYKSDGALGNQLQLGQMQGDVRAKIQAKILGVGYGVTNRWTLYAGIPFANAEVHTNLHLSGANNSSIIQERLGDLAFEELQSALTKAANLTIDDIHHSIESEGYEPIRHWSHQGIGDIEIGSKLALPQLKMLHRPLRTVWTSTISLPTGYTERPDVLTDMSFGREAFGLYNELSPSFRINKLLKLRMSSGLRIHLPAKKEMRVPENNELIVKEERTTEVTKFSGHDLHATTGITGSYRWFNLGMQTGFEHHTKDRYKGKLEGNYKTLGDSSQKSSHFGKLSLGINTARAYKRNRFPVPFLAELSWQKIFHGKNTLDSSFVEFSLSSFFSSKP